VRGTRETRRLGDVLSVQNGYAFDSKRFGSSDGVPLIRIRDLKAGIDTDTRYVGAYDDKYLVQAGDLLIGMDGEFGCYEWRGKLALLNQRVCRLQGFASDLLPRFLFYGVNSHLKAIEDVTGFATVKHLSSKQILGIEFPVPPLREQ
jgi:type I restriction enzyme S subunit